MKKVPKGWFVLQAGQDPLHMLWFVILANFEDFSSGKEDIRHYVAEEKDSFDEAVEECVKQLLEKNEREDGK